jgi:hypothetical protein
MEGNFEYPSHRRFHKLSKEVETQDLDTGRRYYEAVKLVEFSRYDYELESICKFLLVLKICLLMHMYV